MDQIETYAADFYPNIYKIQWEPVSFNNIIRTFMDEILGGCSYSDVESCLISYVTAVVEPVGWKAVWRSDADLDYDLLVEATNVSLDKLEADVVVRSIITSEPNPASLRSIKEKLDEDDTITVPLTELFVVSEEDPEEMYAKTAIAIENVRFFLLKIVRPWDEDEDCMYTEEVLKTRLQLYFDVQNKVLPKEMISKIEFTLKEASKIKKELDKLYAELNASDSEMEVCNEDLIQSLTLRKKLKKLQNKMEMLENPVIRHFLDYCYVKRKYGTKRSSKRNPKSKPVTYVVSQQFTAGMISELPLVSESVLEFEHSPETAFKSSSAGDKIYIFPGVYKCDSLGWVEGNLSAQGVGVNSDIVLEATGNSEVLLNSCAQSVDLHNVTLKGMSNMLSSIIVHHGKLTMKNCIIDNSQAEIGVLLLAGSEAIVDDCTIKNCETDGIQMRCLSSLQLQSSKIMHSSGNGIQIDAENGPSSDSYTELNIIDSFITNNAKHGIHLNNVPISDISFQRTPGDFSILKLFPWVKHKIEFSVIECNGDNSVGVSSLCQNEDYSPAYETKPIPSCPTPDSLNYSALSDLLNEVNLSIERQNLSLDETTRF